jgi:hypothetical protein
MRNILLLCALMFVAPLTQANSAMVDRATGSSFPDNVRFIYNNVDYSLQGTGVATRKKFFVNVYSVAHYIEGGRQLKYSSDIWRQIFSDDKAKQLTLIWARNVDAAVVQEGYTETLKKILSPVEYRKFREQIDAFLSLAGKNVRSHDRHILRWIPGGILEIEINGEKVGTIQDTEFLEAVWKIWLGPKSVVNRNQLISLLR